MVCSGQLHPGSSVLRLPKKGSSDHFSHSVLTHSQMPQWVGLLWGAGTRVSKPPLPVGPADTIDVKGADTVLPNPDVLVPQLVGWVTAPKPEVMAVKKEQTCIIV